jgi:hypothetical protein
LKVKGQKMKNANDNERDTIAQIQLEIIASASGRLQKLVAGKGSGRYLDDDAHTDTLCSLMSKAAQLSSRRADAANDGEHHLFAGKAHQLAEQARAMSGEVDQPDSMRRYHGDASANHLRIATALGFREPSPTIQSTTVGTNDE